MDRDRYLRPAGGLPQPVLAVAGRINQLGLISLLHGRPVTAITAERYDRDAL
jgi:hypothetical protein